jgi:hypothetical protein
MMEGRRTTTVQHRLSTSQVTMRREKRRMLVSKTRMG